MGEAYQLSQKRIKQLDAIDMMPGDLRACVHEFGFPIVATLMKFGIKDTRHIREIVREIWLGPRQAGQRSDATRTVDVLLSRNVVSLKGLTRMLAENNMVIVKVEPTKKMIDASMAEVSDHNIRCTKEEKHRRRLRAALRAAIDDMLD